MTEPGFTGREVADHVGITYRQLDYWARTDLVRPSIADANGQGSRRRYSHNDLLVLQVVKALLDAGQRLERVRLAIACLRGFAADLSDAVVVITPAGVTIAFDPGSLVDAIGSATGAITVLPIRALTDEARR